MLQTIFHHPEATGWEASNLVNLSCTTAVMILGAGCSKSKGGSGGERLGAVERRGVKIQGQFLECMGPWLECPESQQNKRICCQRGVKEPNGPRTTGVGAV